MHTNTKTSGLYIDPTAKDYFVGTISLLDLNDQHMHNIQGQPIFVERYAAQFNLHDTIYSAKSKRITFAEAAKEIVEKLNHGQEDLATHTAIVKSIMDETYQGGYFIPPYYMLRLTLEKALLHYAYPPTKEVKKFRDSFIKCTKNHRTFMSSTTFNQDQQYRLVTAKENHSSLLCGSKRWFNATPAQQPYCRPVRCEVVLPQL